VLKWAIRGKRGGQRLYWLFVAGFLALASFIFFAQPALLQSLRAFAFDAYQRLAPAPQLADSPVRVIAIDERSLQRLGQWPLAAFDHGPAHR
jgi:adenylate cyclase